MVSVDPLKEISYADPPRDRFIDNSKVVFKELAHEKLGSTSPGPVYNSHQINTAFNPKNHAHSFSKESRDLLLL